MQEDIERRTVALSVNATKLTVRTLANVLAAALRQIQKSHQKGRPLNLVPNLLVIALSLEKEALDILVADQINGTKNSMAGTATPLVTPQLAGHDSAWYLLCTQRPIKPILFQRR